MSSKLWWLIPIALAAMTEGATVFSVINYGTSQDTALAICVILMLNTLASVFLVYLRVSSG